MKKRAGSDMDSEAEWSGASDIAGSDGEAGPSGAADINAPASQIVMSLDDEYEEAIKVRDHFIHDHDTDSRFPGPMG
jgi:hypothetical protein